MFGYRHPPADGAYQGSSRMIGYKSRLSRDLKRWLESGIVDADTARAIEADLARQSARISIPSIMAILGAVLLSFAAMTFVAANWDSLSKLTRLSILFGALWTAYGAAWFLQRASMLYLAEAAILLGCGLFGANIMLIAQIYHMEGNPPDAMLLWASGVLLAGIVLQSRPALALAILLFSLWSWWEVFDLRAVVHFPFLLAWAVCAVPIIWMRWQAGYHLLALTMATWIVGLGYLFEQGDVFGTRSANSLVVLLGMLIVGVATTFRRTIDNWAEAFGEHLVLYGSVISFAGLFGLQLIDKTPAMWIAILAVLTLGLVLAGLYYGLHGDNRGLTRLAYVLFCVELLGLYFKTLGTLLDTALFFLIAGVIVILMAIFAGRLSRRVNEGRGA